MRWFRRRAEDDDEETHGAEKKPPSSAVRISQTCPSCGHWIQSEDQAAIQDLPGLPAGVKFDPTDQELLEHLEGKVSPDTMKLHPLVDEFIPTIGGETGICYSHPEKLPGVRKDGLVRHFFHKPSKAYTTGNRKRRKIHAGSPGGETRWHKTGKTRPVLVNGRLAGYKKILVLYAGSSKHRKPEKTSWVMHQYHLGPGAEERDGELVVSKVFYQTQPRQCGGARPPSPANGSCGRRVGEEKPAGADGANVDDDLHGSRPFCKYGTNL